MSPLYEMVKEGIDLKSIQWEALSGPDPLIHRTPARLPAATPAQRTTAYSRKSSTTTRTPGSLDKADPQVGTDSSARRPVATS